MKSERLTKQEAAQYLDLSPRTLNRWHARRIGPPRVKVGGKIWYLRESIDQWVRSQEEQPVREGK